MSPDVFDSMGSDLHACLHTFQLHPATAVALPPRPAHIKSAMRLRRAPAPLIQQEPQVQQAQQQQTQQQRQQRWTPASEKDDNVCGARGRSRGGRPSGRAAEDGSARCCSDDDNADCCGGLCCEDLDVDGDEDDGDVCEHAQHFAWFLLTSACLSKVGYLKMPARARALVCAVGFRRALVFSCVYACMPFVFSRSVRMRRQRRATPRWFSSSPLFKVVPCF